MESEDEENETFLRKNRKILHNKCGNCGFPFSPLFTLQSDLLFILPYISRLDKDAEVC